MAELDPVAAFIQLALDTTAITDVIGTKIKPVRGDQYTAFPYCVVIQDVSQIWQHMLAESSVQRVDILLDVYAETYGEVATIGRLFRDAMSGFTGIITEGADTLVIQHLRLTQQDDFDDPISLGRDKPAYHRQLEFSMGYVTTPPSP